MQKTIEAAVKGVKATDVTEKPEFRKLHTIFFVDFDAIFFYISWREYSTVKGGTRRP